MLERIGADVRDDEELRQKKALVVLITVLILPVSALWGVLYLALGSLIGISPLVYFAVSLGSLVVFARTRRFQPFLLTQLVDILVMPTTGQMLLGGFLASGGVGLWGILAPLGALVFLEVRQAVRWFIAFVVVFLVTGLAGEIFISNADLPVSFTTTMLALNVIGAASISFTLLALFARERNEALKALRAEQEKSELLVLNILPRPIAERLKVAAEPIADHLSAVSIVFADVVDFTPLAQRLPPAEMVRILDHLFSDIDMLVERHGLEKIKTIGDCYMAAAGVPNQRPDHAHKAALLALDMREVLATSAVDDQPGLELRIGINSGPVVAGVIGKKRFLYDLWGEVRRRRPATRRPSRRGHAPRPGGTRRRSRPCPAPRGATPRGPPPSGRRRWRRRPPRSARRPRPIPAPPPPTGLADGGQRLGGGLERVAQEVCVCELRGDPQRTAVVIDRLLGCPSATSARLMTVTDAASPALGAHD